MGVCINFSGQLKSAGHFAHLERVGRRWAKHWKCDLNEVEHPSFPFFRVVNDEVMEVSGPMRGLTLHPHPECESVRLFFNKELYLDHWCKTQFAPPDTHVEVCAFLRDIEPLFDGFNVIDDGGFWETGDRAELERRLGFLNRMIDRIGTGLEAKGHKVQRRGEGEPPRSSMN